jgi:hypothetical protein
MTTDIGLERRSAVIHGMVEVLRGGPKRAGPLHKDCLGYRYGHCREFSHCGYCSTIEQALRAAASLQPG